MTKAFYNPMLQEYSDSYDWFEISKGKQLGIKLQVYPNSQQREN